MRYCKEIGVDVSAVFGESRQLMIGQHSRQSRWVSVIGLQATALMRPPYVVNKFTDDINDAAYPWRFGWESDGETQCRRPFDWARSLLGWDWGQ